MTADRGRPQSRNGSTDTGRVGSPSRCTAVAAADSSAASTRPSVASSQTSAAESEGGSGSRPDNACQARARSPCSRTSTPSVSKLSLSGITPSIGSRPARPFSPQIPQQAAGMRTLPAVSVPSASGTAPAATASAEPPLEPPAIASGCRGLRTPGVMTPAASSCVAVFPTGIAPRARSPATTAASARAGGASCSARVPARVGSPATSARSLTASGTPWSGPGWGSRARRRAVSGSTTTNAPRSRVASIRRRHASRSSLGVISRERSRATVSRSERSASPASMRAGRLPGCGTARHGPTGIDLIYGAIATRCWRAREGAVTVGGGRVANRREHRDQRRRVRARDRTAPAALGLHPPRGGPHRHPRRLRARRVRRLHGAARRRADPLLPDARRPGERPPAAHGRGARRARRPAAPAPAGVPRDPRAPVRVLHARVPDGDRAAAARRRRARRPAAARAARRQPVPLHRLRVDRERGPARPRADVPGGRPSMKPAPFDYLAPTSVEETLELLAARGEEGKLLAGGQSLVPMLNFRLAQPEALIDINHVAELAYVARRDGALHIGALTRHAELERSTLVAEHWPLLTEA